MAEEDDLHIRHTRDETARPSRYGDRLPSGRSLSEEEKGVLIEGYYKGEERLLAAEDLYKHGEIGLSSFLREYDFYFRRYQELTNPLKKDTVVAALFRTHTNTLLKHMCLDKRRSSALAASVEEYEEAVGSYRKAEKGDKKSLSSRAWRWLTEKPDGYKPEKEEREPDKFNLAAKLRPIFDSFRRLSEEDQGRFRLENKELRDTFFRTMGISDPEIIKWSRFVKRPKPIDRGRKRVDNKRMAEDDRLGPEDVAVAGETINVAEKGDLNRQVEEGLHRRLARWRLGKEAIEKTRGKDPILVEVEKLVGGNPWLAEGTTGDLNKRDLRPGEDVIIVGDEEIGFASERSIGTGYTSKVYETNDGRVVKIYNGSRVDIGRPETCEDLKDLVVPSIVSNSDPQVGKNFPSTKLARVVDSEGNNIAIATVQERISGPDFIYPPRHLETLEPDERNKLVIDLVAQLANFTRAYTSLGLTVSGDTKSADYYLDPETSRLVRLDYNRFRWTYKRPYDGPNFGTELSLLAIPALGVDWKKWKEEGHYGHGRLEISGAAKQLLDNVLAEKYLTAEELLEDIEVCHQTGELPEKQIGKVKGSLRNKTVLEELGFKGGMHQQISTRIDLFGKAFFGDYPIKGLENGVRSNYYHWTEGECRDFLQICDENRSVIDRVLSDPSEGVEDAEFWQDGAEYALRGIIHQRFALLQEDRLSSLPSDEAEELKEIIQDSHEYSLAELKYCYEKLGYDLSDLEGLEMSSVSGAAGAEKSSREEDRPEEVEPLSDDDRSRRRRAARAAVRRGRTQPLKSASSGSEVPFLKGWQPLEADQESDNLPDPFIAYLKNTVRHLVVEDLDFDIDELLRSGEGTIRTLGEIDPNWREMTVDGLVKRVTDNPRYQEIEDEKERRERARKDVDELLLRVAMSQRIAGGLIRNAIEVEKEKQRSLRQENLLDLEPPPDDLIGPPDLEDHSEEDDLEPQTALEISVDDLSKCLRQVKDGKASVGRLIESVGRFYENYTEREYKFRMLYLITNVGPNLVLPEAAPTQDMETAESMGSWDDDMGILREKWRDWDRNGKGEEGMGSFITAIGPIIDRYSSLDAKGKEENRPIVEKLMRVVDDEMTRILEKLYEVDRQKRAAGDWGSAEEDWTN